MRKAQIREEVNTALREMGFKTKQMRWHGCNLDLIVGGEFRTLRFPSGIPKRMIAFELGRVAGWLEIITERAQTEQVREIKMNGAHHGATA